MWVSPASSRHLQSLHCLPVDKDLKSPHNLWIFPYIQLFPTELQSLYMRLLYINLYRPHICVLIYYYSCDYTEFYWCVLYSVLVQLLHNISCYLACLAPACISCHEKYVKYSLTGDPVEEPSNLELQFWLPF